MRSLTALAPFLVVIATALHAQSPAPAIDRLLRPAVRIAGQADTAYTLEERMRYYHVPGVSLAVIENGRIVFARGYGVAEFGGARAVDTTTLFLAGSISKPVFATGALALVEQGRLSLDADVNGALKSWRLPESRFTATEKVTLRRLLTHTAGLTVWGFPGYAAGRPVPTIPQILDGATPANTQAVRNDTLPGALWRYSGGGITIAQLMAEDATGEAFPSLMHRLVLRPAGMTRSTFENPLPAARHAEAASGHERIDTPVLGRFHTYPEMAAAGLWTTAPDLARWAIALARAYNGEAGGLLSPAMARQMVSPIAEVKPPYGRGHWGLGVGVNGTGDSVSFMHNGRDEGFVANLVMWPRLGRGLVVLTNGVSGALMGELTRAFAERHGVPAGAPRVERAVVSVDMAALAPLAGTYDVSPTAPGHSPITLEVTFTEGALHLRDSMLQRTMRLYAEGRDVFFDRNSGQRFTFERESPDPNARGRTVAQGEGPQRRVGVRR